MRPVLICQPAALVLVAGLLTGCYDLEETIVLRRDLSGSISILATLHTEDENDRDEFERDKATLVDDLRRQAKEQIPEGVRLRHLDLEWLGPKRIAARIEIEFDHVRRLQEIESEENEGGLGDFEVVEEEGAWRVRMRMAEKPERDPNESIAPPSTYEGRTFLLTVRPEGEVAGHNGEAVGPDLVWKKKMKEIVDPPSDLWAEWTIRK